MMYDKAMIALKLLENSSITNELKKKCHEVLMEVLNQKPYEISADRKTK